MKVLLVHWFLESYILEEQLQKLRHLIHFAKTYARSTPSAFPVLFQTRFGDVGDDWQRAAPCVGADGTAHTGVADETKKPEKAESTEAAQDEQGSLAPSYPNRQTWNILELFVPTSSWHQNP